MVINNIIDIPAGEIRAALAARGVLALHYAASVEDACRFLRAGALLTAGDVFLDATDVHARARRPNKCGPVLFVFEAALLTTQPAGVCKCYPSAWPGNAASACWFADGEEIVRDFIVGRNEHMIVLHAGGSLPFDGHLVRVIVDASELAALPAMHRAMADGGIDTVIAPRSCTNDCTCGQNR